MPSINLKDTGSKQQRPKNTMHQRAYKDSRYNGRRWRNLRDFVIQSNPFCVECEQVATVVDHVNPVRLGGLFYDITNLQSMCSSCHNSKSSLERYEPQGGKGGR